MSVLKQWSATAPLTRGTTLIEASAGTGKTYNIASLVLRLIAEEDLQIDRILVVTYTRAATAELKERVRLRLVEAIAALGLDTPPSDPVLEKLWREPTVRLTRIQRLRRAVESFDRALISTIHGFCQRMLQQSAFESGVAFDLELTPETGDIVEEIVDDFLTRTFYAVDRSYYRFLRTRCGFRREALRTLGAAALADPDTVLVPAPNALSHEGWDAEVQGLLSDWTDLGTGLLTRLNKEVKRAALDQGVLKKRQRKYTEKSTVPWLKSIGDWLKSNPVFGSLPPDHARFHPDTMKNQLLNPAVHLNDPCIERLNTLCTFPDRVAAGLRSAFVAELREAFEVRKQTKRIQTYDDLLRGLSLRLGPDADPAGREALAQTIGDAFDAALIDEFQDTDHHQWTLFREVFGDGRHHLYLIGDPKQAIYGFRGANIHVYSEATEHAGESRFTMSTNWRSDPSLLEGLNQLLDQPGAFGASVSFGYVRVAAPKGRKDGVIPVGPAVRFRWFDHNLLNTEPLKIPTKTALSGVLEDRVAADIVELLQSNTLLEGQPVQPGDVAVLVRTGFQANLLQEALRKVRVPAVLSGAKSVLASDEAREIQHWIEALASSSGAATRVAASTHLFGWTAEDLQAVEAEDPAVVVRWERWLELLQIWRSLFRKRGFMAAFRSALDAGGAMVRLLHLRDGERRVTNVLHVAELIHAAESRERLQPASLLAWLKARRSADDLDRSVAELRLDRDADAVHLFTIHKSKGLEFPICFVPYLWDGSRGVPRANEVLLVPNPANKTERILDVGLPALPEHTEIAEVELKEEALRLAYVALTRAKHQVVIYAGHCKHYEHSPLAAILHGRGADRIAFGQQRVEDKAELLFDDLKRLRSAQISVSLCAPADGASWSVPLPAIPKLSARVFQRPQLDPGWRRHSYTSLTRQAGHPVLIEDGREGFDSDAVDRPEVSQPTDVLPDEVPLASFPSGPEAGTLLHAIFEYADFGGTLGVLEKVVERSLHAHGFGEEHRDVLVSGLSAVFETPLGGPLAGCALRDIPRSARLDELRFDLPILGGSQVDPEADLRSPTATLITALQAREHGLPADWLRSLERLEEVELAGFLTGSIDLVFQHEGRWYVVDYKSNRIDPKRTGRCVPEGFSRPRMTAEMARHDYFLQYYLYTVALHRYLRWRLDDYDYDTHIGGIYYLFFRGMVGRETAQSKGVVHGSWYDRPDREVIEAIDAGLMG